MKVHSEMPDQNFRSLFAGALQQITGEKVTSLSGFSSEEVDAAEKRLSLKLPAALHDFYETVGKLPINYEHNRLYSPKELKVLEGKLVFQEENQVVVFWGLEIGDPDPIVFQTNNELPIQWFSLEMPFSEFVIKLLRWQSGAGDPPL